jgi:hypothetical protein
MTNPALIPSFDARISLSVLSSLSIDTSSEVSTWRQQIMEFKNALLQEQNQHKIDVLSTAIQTRREWIRDATVSSVKASTSQPKLASIVRIKEPKKSLC